VLNVLVAEEDNEVTDNVRRNHLTANFLTVTSPNTSLAKAGVDRRNTQKLRNSNTEIILQTKTVESVRLVNPELVNHILSTLDSGFDSLPEQLKVKDYIICQQDVESNSNFLTRNLVIHES